jgi:hypothetical protein
MRGTVSAMVRAERTPPCSIRYRKRPRSGMWKVSAAIVILMAPVAISTTDALRSIVRLQRRYEESSRKFAERLENWLRPLTSLLCRVTTCFAPGPHNSEVSEKDKEPRIKQSKSALLKLYSIMFDFSLLISIDLVGLFVWI